MNSSEGWLNFKHPGHPLNIVLLARHCFALDYRVSLHHFLQPLIDSGEWGQAYSKEVLENNPPLEPRVNQNVRQRYIFPQYIGQGDKRLNFFEHQLGLLMKMIVDIGLSFGLVEDVDHFGDYFVDEYPHFKFLIRV